MEDGGGAVLEPKDLLVMGKSEDLYIQLNCGRGRMVGEKKMFRAKYVFDCVRKNTLLPNLSEYLCKQKGEKEGEKIEKLGEFKDPLQVCSYPLRIIVG